MIPLPVQHQMGARAGAAVSEVAASRSLYIVQPTSVADMIKQAAASVPN